MQDKNNNNSQLLGICHRLFNFFMDSLISRGLKRVTLGHPQVKPKDDSGSEIQVVFKQTEEELEYWTSVDKLGSSVHGLEKDRPFVGSDQGPLQTSSSSTTPVKDRVPDDKTTGRRYKVSNPLGEMEIPHVQVIGVSKDRIDSNSTVQGKGVEPNATSVAQAGGPKESVIKDDDSEEDSKRKKKGKSIASENLTPTVEPKDSARKNIPNIKRIIELEHEQSKPKTPPRHMKLLNVTPNINEKSSEFIESMRKKLSGNSGTEEKKS